MYMAREVQKGREATKGTEQKVLNRRGEARAPRPCRRWEINRQHSVWVPKCTGTVSPGHGNETTCKLQKPERHTDTGSLSKK